MTIIRLESGDLLLYSVVAMDETGMFALEQLGKPKYMLIPHPWHIMDAAFYKERYPDLVVIAANDAQEVLVGHLKVDGPPETLLPSGLRHHTARGSRFQETILDVDTNGGRALFFTDLFASNAPDSNFLIRLLGPPGGTGTPRLVKFRQVLDKPTLGEFFKELAELPEVQIVAGCHGPAITSNCGAVLRETASGL